MTSSTKNRGRTSPWPLTRHGNHAHGVQSFLLTQRNYFWTIIVQTSLSMTASPGTSPSPDSWHQLIPIRCRGTSPKLDCRFARYHAVQKCQRFLAIGPGNRTQGRSPLQRYSPSLFVFFLVLDLVCCFPFPFAQSTVNGSFPFPFGAFIFLVFF